MLNNWQLNKQHKKSKKETINSRKNNFHDYFRNIPFQYLEKLLKKNNIKLKNKSVHIAGCGSGTDIEYLSKFIDARYTATDLSEEAVQVTQTKFPGVECKVDDLEQLSFADDFFDYSYVAAALHHLHRPVLGIYELLRVSKYGLIVIEPNDTWLTRIIVKMGVAQEYEAEGNYVYRFSEHDVKKITKSLFYEYHSIRFFAIHRIAKSSFEFLVLKVLNGLSNIFFPSLGNYNLFIILKK